MTEVQPGTLKVTTGRGVSLEVLDWGGRGRALVFVAGGGRSTARIFEGFAPILADSFRVIGITRRGRGSSDAVRPRRFDDYIDDVVAVLDAMKIDSVVLVGHSYGGLELARFGVRHNDRCAALIYLDAAYDQTDTELGKILETHQPPSAPPMQAADSASMAAVQAWYARTQGFSPNEATLRATRRFDASGRLIGEMPSRTDDWAVEIPITRWESVRCPSLGVFPVPVPYETSLPYWSALDSAQQRRANAYFNAFVPWTRKNRAAFGRVPLHQVVEFPSGNHYFFLEKPEEAARVIRRYLARSP